MLECVRVVYVCHPQVQYVPQYGYFSNFAQSRVRMVQFDSQSPIFDFGHRSGHTVQNESKMAVFRGFWLISQRRL